MSTIPPFSHPEMPRRRASSISAPAPTGAPRARPYNNLYTPVPPHNPQARDPFYQHEEVARITARFITHLFACPENPPIQSYWCLKCGKSFNDLDRHLRIHEIHGFSLNPAIFGPGGMGGGGMGMDMGADVSGGRPVNMGSNGGELTKRRRFESASVPRGRSYPYPHLGIQRPGRVPPSQYPSMADGLGPGSLEARERARVEAATLPHQQLRGELIPPIPALRIPSPPSPSPSPPLLLLPLPLPLPSPSPSDDLGAQKTQDIIMGEPPSDDLSAQKTQDITMGEPATNAEPPSESLLTSERAFPIREPSITSLSSNSITISGAETTAEDIWRLLTITLSNKSAYKTLLRLKDEKAQIMLDILQKALDSRDIPVKLGHAARYAMMRLCTTSGVYPRCLALQDIHYEATPVASGTFGDIWKGNYGNHPVCLKVARVYQGSNVEHLTKTYMREAIMWSYLSHPNLLPLYGIYRVDDRLGRICLVSPWMQNGNVNEYLKAHPEAPRLPLARDIVEGLRYLHKQSVVHGDLKGANVLISAAGSACLADFGLSSIVDPEILRWTSLTTMTQVGGTVRWQAPEVMDDTSDGSRPTFSADVYSTASVMYEVFTDQLPFYDIRNNTTVMLRVIQGFRPTRPPLDQAPELSNGIWEIIESCWNSNPIERPSINQVAERLSRARPTETTISRVHTQKIQRKRDMGEDVPTPSSFRAAMRGQTTYFSKAETDTLEELARDSLQPTLSPGTGVKPALASLVRPGGSLSPPPSQEVTSLDWFAPPNLGATDPYFEGLDEALTALGISYMSAGVNNWIKQESDTSSLHITVETCGFPSSSGTRT